MQNRLKKFSNIRLRAISAVIILFTFLFGLLYSKYFFAILMFIVFIGMMIEWYLMAHESNLDLALGLIIFPFSCGSLIIARFIENDHMPLIIYFTIIWIVDTMGMIGGKLIGGIKLAPRISPNKTWSGLIIGAVSAGIATVLLTCLPNFNSDIFNRIGAISIIRIFIFGSSLAVISQISDLFMSYFKRKFRIKDSGNMIPGHGGMIDRFDSIVLTAPIILYILL